MTLSSGPALIPIGTFSSVTHLTQKTLRFYAEQGILSPAWVAPENGYRYSVKHLIHHRNLSHSDQRRFTAQPQSNPLAREAGMRPASGTLDGTAGV